MKTTILAAVLALALLPVGLRAQDAAPAAPAAPNADRMAEFRARMNEQLKTALKATDEEWAVIAPLLEKVQTKQRETMSRRFNAFAGPRGPGGGDRPGRGGDRSGRGGDRAQPTPSPESAALKAALDAEGSSDADIKAKLEAVRAAHKKAAAELEQARTELREVLTLRQEATLVMMGILE